ncbi:MAG TPA: molybdate ABC transporter substrate-binding protein [Acidimicrobiales bacterium]|nr:molybdate ABC transporter substrate-binding protein [Acidimicrobiales bacterium]
MRRIVASFVAALVVAGCTTASEPTLTVLAAASLAEAFADLDPGEQVRYSFAGSQQLVAQVEAGVPADVVATADEAAMDRLVRANLVETPVVFARNKLAIAVRPGNPGRIRVLADLARPGLRLALADGTVPVGRFAQQALQKGSVRVRPVSLELDVKAVVSRVASGEAEAGIVYATDVTRASGVEGVAIPDDLNVVATYPAAVVRAGANRPLARRFVFRLTGDRGRAALAAHGFLAP